MSVVSDDHPGSVGEAETPALAPHHIDEDVFEDASEDGEVDFKRPGAPPPPMFDFRDAPRPYVPQVGGHFQFKPREFDGVGWPEYRAYFDQLGDLNRWDDHTKALVLGLSLKGDAARVLLGIPKPRRGIYRCVLEALDQNFAPEGLMYLHKAQLKARRKKDSESMAELGRDIARLVRLAYPGAEPEWMETMGIDAFLDSLPGPASTYRLQVSMMRPKTLQEAVTIATNVDTIVGMDHKSRRGEVRVLTNEDPINIEEVEKKLNKLENMIQGMQRRSSGWDKREVVCYRCKQKGHVQRHCTQPAVSTDQGNGSGRLEARQ